MRIISHFANGAVRWQFVIYLVHRNEPVASCCYIKFQIHLRQYLLIKMLPHFHHQRIPIHCLYILHYRPYEREAGYIKIWLRCIIHDFSFEK